MASTRENLKRRREEEDSPQEDKRICFNSLAAALEEIPLKMSGKRSREEEPETENKKRCTATPPPQTEVTAIEAAFRALPEEVQKQILPDQGKTCSTAQSLHRLSVLELHCLLPREAVHFLGVHLRNLKEVTVQSPPTPLHLAPVLDLEPLSCLPQLECLVLYHCQLSGLEHFGGESSVLRRLELHHCLAQSPQWVEHISAVVSLEEVSLVRCSPALRNEDLEAMRETLRNLKKLSLELQSQRLKFSSLSGLSSLEVLSLKGINFAEDRFENSWEGLPRLRIVNISFCGSLLHAMNHLAETATVEEMALEYSFICDIVADNLKAAKFRLQKLTVKHYHVSISGWEVISRLCSLRFLHLAGDLNDDDLIRVGDVCLSLDTLRLESCPNITEVGLRSLQRLSLQTLEIIRCEKISRDDFENAARRIHSLSKKDYQPVPGEPENKDGDYSQLLRFERCFPD